MSRILVQIGKTFRTPIEDKLISPKQLDNFYRKREESLTTTSLTSVQFGNSLQCEASWQKLPA